MAENHHANRVRKKGTKIWVHLKPEEVLLVVDRRPI
jgi:hypothetical protein